MSVTTMTYQRSKVVLVDIQSVIGNNGQYFVKELVYMFANSINPVQHILKPPYAFEELNDDAVTQDKYLYHNVTRLRWNDGNDEYLQLPNILNNIQEYTIIVKGDQKKTFLQKFLKNSVIINLDDNISLNSMRNYFHNCQIHDSSFYRCAVLNVYKMLFHMEKNSMLNE